jgi:hypothetical protein
MPKRSRIAAAKEKKQQSWRPRAYEALGRVEGIGEDMTTFAQSAYTTGTLRSDAAAQHSQLFIK